MFEELSSALLIALLALVLIVGTGIGFYAGLTVKLFI